VGKRKYETIEDMQKKIDNYFDYCEKNKKPFTVSGRLLLGYQENN